MAKEQTMSSYRLSPIASRGLELETIIDSLKTQLRFERKRQQATICHNKNVDCTAKTQYSNAAARELISLKKTPKKSFRRQYNWDEMTRAETYRLLSTYQQRLAIAKTLQKHDWKLDYIDRPEEHKYVKNQEWNNLQASRKLPTLPRVKSVRLPLSKSDNHAYNLDQQDNKLTLYLGTLKGDCALEFELPSKVLAQYKGRKVSRPDIVLDANDNLSFVFSIDANSPKDKGKVTQSLGVDIGIVRPYAASLVTKDKTTVIGSHSLEVERALKGWKRNNERVKALSDKNKRREALGVSNPNAVREEKRLRAKLERQRDSLDWQVANDVVSLTPEGTIIGLELLNWGKGGPVKFRHSLQQAKIEHLAAKEGRRVVKVNPKNSSHECPNCEAFVSPNGKRITNCDACGFQADRDDAGSIVIGKRALPVSVRPKKQDRTKSQPTPSRPKPRPRNNMRRSSKRKTGYTSSCLSRATGLSRPATLEAGYSAPLSRSLTAWRARSTLWE